MRRYLPKFDSYGITNSFLFRNQWWSSFQLTTLLIILFIDSINACGSKGKTVIENPPPPNPSALKNMVGNINTSPYDNSGFDAKNGQANSPDDLKCDFESQCCWKNARPPYDTMEWIKASGTPDAQKLQANFGTSTPPTGNWLVVAADTPAGPADKAEFDSCTIQCAGDTINVTLKHWLTQGVTLQVCQVAQSDPTTLLNCQNVPSKSPGPDTIQLPGGQNIFLAISASNFVASGGSVAMIDDISVAYPPCVSTTASQAPTTAVTSPPAITTPSTAELNKLCCSFASGNCNYNKGSGPQPAPPGTVNDFQNAGPQQFRNPATGVPPSPDKQFAACYMKPKENGYMESQANINQPIMVKFQEYRATQDVNLQACCDSLQNCNYNTGGKVQKTDFRQWYQGSIQCPAGTKKIAFYSQNSGVNEGGVGVDNIQVFDGSGNQIC